MPMPENLKKLLEQAIADGRAAVIGSEDGGNCPSCEELRYKCLLAAMRVHKGQNVNGETVAKTAQRFFSFVRPSVDHGEAPAETLVANPDAPAAATVPTPDVGVPVPETVFA